MADIQQWIEQAITDPAVTVGTVIDMQNQPYQPRVDRPHLCPVLVDSVGRFWREDYRKNLVCILDLRTLSASIDAGPS